MEYEYIVGILSEMTWSSDESRIDPSAITSIAQNIVDESTDEISAQWMLDEAICDLEKESPEKGELETLVDATSLKHWTYVRLLAHLGLSQSHPPTEQ